MNQPSPSLSQLQNWMQTVITNPGGVAAGVQSQAARQAIDVSVEDLESVITRSKKLNASDRLAIYGNAYFARLLECMRQIFPVLCEVFGEELFDQFSLDYLVAHPSQSYTLDQLASRFVSFLESTRPDQAEGDEQENGWIDFLIDLARLEWAIDRVFDGPGAERLQPLDGAALADIDPAVWLESQFEMAPCLQLLTFRYPVNDFFTAFRKDPGAEIPAAATSFVALSRRQFIVRRYTLTQQQHALLTALLAGETVAVAIERAAELTDDPATFAADLRQWFFYWTSEGFFVRLMS